MNRLTPNDAMFYFLDETGTTTHLGALLIVSTEAGGTRDSAASSSGRTRSSHRPLDYPSLVSLVENRLQAAPRYRQVVREVTLGLARPVWVDDPDFDINFHIRRSGLPRPGDLEQLQDLIARVMSRPLDRTRPLWEMYLIEGLADGQLAVLTKSHRCLVDGSSAPEISEVICDETAETPELPEDLWMPGSPPGSTQLAVGAIAEALSRPGDLVESVVTGNGPVADLRSVTGAVIRRVGSVVQQLTDSAPSSPLNNATTSTRSFTVTSVPSRSCAKVAEHFECSMNDVLLAVITGVMRRWLLSLDDSLPMDGTVRVVLPLAARDPGVETQPDKLGAWTAVAKPSFVTDLPVGEDNPAVRLAQVAGLADRYSQSPRRLSLGLRPLFPELGVVPFGEFSSRAFSSLDRRTYNVPVAMGNRPVATRYLAGHRVSEIFGVPTLEAQRALAISVVEYDSRLHFGFVADRGVMADLPAMADYVTESLDELMSSVVTRSGR